MFGLVSLDRYSQCHLVFFVFAEPNLPDVRSWVKVFLDNLVGDVMKCDIVNNFDDDPSIETTTQPYAHLLWFD